MKYLCLNSDQVGTYVNSYSNELNRSYLNSYHGLIYPKWNYIKKWVKLNMRSYQMNSINLKIQFEECSFLILLRYNQLSNILTL